MLPYDLSVVLCHFLRPVVCFDEFGKMENFEFVKTKSEKYSVLGVLIPPTDSDLQLFDEGELQTGSMILYTGSNVNLYFHDLIQKDQPEARQTYVCFQGRTYRIKGCSNRAEDGLHKKWTMVRYVER